MCCCHGCCRGVGIRLELERDYEGRERAMRGYDYFQRGGKGYPVPYLQHVYFSDVAWMEPLRAAPAGSAPVAPVGAAGGAKGDEALERGIAEASARLHKAGFVDFDTAIANLRGKRS